MDNLFIAVILSIVEGLTEFLPVSSSGHLILAGDLLGFTGSKAATFEVVIQLGAILAVMILYWQKFKGLLLPDKNANKGFSGINGIWLLILTTFPACITGLLLHGIIKTWLFNPFSVLCALVAGAICMIAVSKLSLKIKYASLDELTPKAALGIGICQCFALWPGFSRSASTIMGGMIFGCSRSLSAEYSFIAAVPVMFAATGYDLLKNWQLFSMADVPFFAVGMAGSFISAIFAVKIFISLVSKITLIPFAIYRLALAPLLYFVLYS